MVETANLKLPLVSPAQAQKHVTINEALSRIDAALQLSVESRTQIAPPNLSENGQCYLVAVGAVDEWAGNDGNLSVFVNGGWDFIAPQLGWEIFVRDEALRLFFDGAQWVPNLLAASPNGAAMRSAIIEVDFELSGGSAQEETGFVIPAQSSVFGVTGRVLSGFSGGLQSWSLGVSGAETRYGSGLGVSPGSWLRGLSGAPITYYSPTKLLLTANEDVFGDGVVRLAVHLLEFDLPNG